MPSRFVDTNGLRPARSMTYENRRRQEINRQIEQALDESDVLLASIPAKQKKTKTKTEIEIETDVKSSTDATLTVNRTEDLI